MHFVLIIANDWTTFKVHFLTIRDYHYEVRLNQKGNSVLRWDWECLMQCCLPSFASLMKYKVRNTTWECSRSSVPSRCTLQRRIGDIPTLRNVPLLPEMGLRDDHVNVYLKNFYSRMRRSSQRRRTSMYKLDTTVHSSGGKQRVSETRDVSS